MFPSTWDGRAEPCHHVGAAGSSWVVAQSRPLADVAVAITPPIFTWISDRPSALTVGSGRRWTRLVSTANPLNPITTSAIGAPGGIVVVRGSNGGVGSTLVQPARHAGLSVLIAGRRGFPSTDAASALALAESRTVAGEMLLVP